MKPVQFLLLPLILFALGKVIHKYRRQGMRTGEFLFWVLVWGASALIIAFPTSTSVVAHLLGIGRGADLIMYSALLVVFYLLFRVHLALDRLEQAVTEVVRELALDRITGPGERR